MLYCPEWYYKRDPIQRCNWGLSFDRVDVSLLRARVEGHTSVLGFGPSRFASRATVRFRTAVPQPEHVFSQRSSGHIWSACVTVGFLTGD
jgi:hypothetical protein